VISEALTTVDHDFIEVGCNWMSAQWVENFKNIRTLVTSSECNFKPRFSVSVFDALRHSYGSGLPFDGSVQKSSNQNRFRAGGANGVPSGANDAAMDWKKRGFWLTTTPNGAPSPMTFDDGMPSRKNRKAN
jgi:hypothetical protein